MKKVLNFIFILLVSFLALEGLEHFLELRFGIDLRHLLSFGGIGTIALIGFKFHIFCCALPMLISTIICIRKRHTHCEHDHKGQHDSFF